MLSEIIFILVQNWQELNEKQKQLRNDYVFSSKSARTYDYIIFGILEVRNLLLIRTPFYMQQGTRICLCWFKRSFDF